MSITDQDYYNVPPVQDFAYPFRCTNVAFENPEYFTDVYVNPISVLQILKHALTTAFLKPPLEIMGIALGTFDPEKHSYFITNSIIIPFVGKGAAVDPPDSIQTIAEYRSQLLQKLGRNDGYISWYHSHPNLHVFYSRKDVNTHFLHWNALRGTFVGFVVDPNNTISSGYLNFAAFSVTDQNAAKQKPKPKGEVYRKYGEAANFYYELKTHYYSSKPDKIVLEHIISKTYSSSLRLSQMTEHSRFLNEREAKKEDVGENEDRDPISLEDMLPTINTNFMKGLIMHRMIKKVFK